MSRRQSFKGQSRTNAQESSDDEAQNKTAVEAYSQLLTGLKVAPIGRGFNRERAHKRRKLDGRGVAKVVDSGKKEYTVMAASMASEVRLRSSGSADILKVLPCLEILQMLEKKRTSSTKQSCAIPMK